MCGLRQGACCWGLCGLDLGWDFGSVQLGVGVVGWFKFNGFSWFEVENQGFLFLFKNLVPQLF